MKILVDDDHYPNIGVMVEEEILNKQFKNMTTRQVYGKAKTKTFNSGSDIVELINWFNEMVETEEIPSHDFLGVDYTTKTLKKYRITVMEVIPKKYERRLKENGVTE